MTQHLSPDEIAQWIAGFRAPQTESHLSACAQCSAAVARTERTFALFRESGQRWSGHCYRQRHGPSPRRLLPDHALVAAMAIAAALFAAIATWHRPAVPRANHLAEQPFVDMPYVAPLAPYERIEVVRMRVSVAALERAGLEIHASDTGAIVLADLLLGQDGRAHAVRLVSDDEISNRSVPQ
jgi:hypothetical protein